VWLYWSKRLTLERWREEYRLVEERFSLFQSFAEMLAARRWVLKCRRGARSFHLVLPFPDSRRQKAETAAVCVRPDNVRRGAVAEP
jgi:hypothetical protein